MGSAARIDEIHLLTIEEFLATPRILFGPAWRYELHDGVVVAQAGPSDRHAIILGNLATMLGNQTIDSRDCTLFDGGVVVPRGKKKANARVPDATVKCGRGDEQSVYMFEVVSPADEVGKELRTLRRQDLKSVPGAQALVEIRQDVPIVHVHRLVGDLWAYEDIVGIGQTLSLEGAGLKLPLERLYRKVYEEPELDQDET
jgi:Uma2 family endonuclease